MSLKEEIKDYIDTEGFVSPEPIDPLETLHRGSDNGLLYTSEYIVLLHKRKELTPEDTAIYLNMVLSCIDENGLLSRHPHDNFMQEGSDDYYGVLNACKAVGNTHIARLFLGAINKYCGFLNNVNPGKPTLSSFLVRQPQFITSVIAAAFPSPYCLLHIAIRLLFFPFFLITAMIIATAGIFAGKEDLDNRRLTWHVLNNTKSCSILCYIASRFWWRRLYKDYGDQGMRAVADEYYKPKDAHPFAQYWVNE